MAPRKSVRTGFPNGPVPPPEPDVMLDEMLLGNARPLAFAVVCARVGISKLCKKVAIADQDEKLPLPILLCM